MRMNFTHPPIDLAKLNAVTTLEGAQNYYHDLQGELFRGVPGVALGPEAFASLRPLLEAYRNDDADDAGHIWLLPSESGGTRIATHLHRARPGRALTEFLRSKSLSALGMRFAARWQSLEPAAAGTGPVLRLSRGGGAHADGGAGAGGKSRFRADAQRSSGTAPLSENPRGWLGPGGSY